MIRYILGIVLLFVSMIGCDNSELATPIIIEDEPVTGFAKGADVSWMTQMEAGGQSFFNDMGNQVECIALMKSLGMSAIRLRVWVDPTSGWCNAQEVLVKALRVKNENMRLMIDFHYSDTWADPGNQYKPAVWQDYDFEHLTKAVSEHTTEVLELLKQYDITPEWVQVGNETRNGMLWNDGGLTNGFDNYATLSNAGYNAVKEVFPDCKVIVHIHNGFDQNSSVNFFTKLNAAGGKWDVVGLSVYPFWYYQENDWESCNNDVLANMNELVSRFNTEVMVVECGYSWDKAEESYLFLTDLIAKTKSVNNNKGTGVFYWEPQSYGGWQGYSFGAFDLNGKPTKAMDAFHE